MRSILFCLLFLPSAVYAQEGKVSKDPPSIIAYEELLRKVQAAKENEAIYFSIGCNAEGCLRVDDAPAAYEKWAVYKGFNRGGTATSQPAPIPARTGTPLDEVNAQRVRSGRWPFIFDPNLGSGAVRCAIERARLGLTGHLQGGSGDFGMLPPNLPWEQRPRATGAGWGSPGTGWSSCCADENWKYAGAGVAAGPNGGRFMSLFVR